MTKVICLLRGHICVTNSYADGFTQRFPANTWKPNTMPRPLDASLSLSPFHDLVVGVKACCCMRRRRILAQAGVVHFLYYAFHCSIIVSSQTLRLAFTRPLLVSQQAEACVLRHTQGMNVSTHATRGQVLRHGSTFSCHGLSGFTTSTQSCSCGRFTVIGLGRWLLDALRLLPVRNHAPSTLDCRFQPCFEQRGDITLLL